MSFAYKKTEGGSIGKNMFTLNRSINMPNTTEKLEALEPTVPSFRSSHIIIGTNQDQYKDTGQFVPFKTEPMAKKIIKVGIKTKIKPSILKKQKQNTVKGSIIEINENYVSASLEIGPKITRKVNLERSLFDKNIRYGSSFNLSIEVDNGFRRPKIEILNQNLNKNSAVYQEAMEFLDQI